MKTILSLVIFLSVSLTPLLVLSGNPIRKAPPPSSDYGQIAWLALLFVVGVLARDYWAKWQKERQENKDRLDQTRAKLSEADIAKASLHEQLESIRQTLKKLESEYAALQEGVTKEVIGVEESSIQKIEEEISSVVAGRKEELASIRAKIESVYAELGEAIRSCQAQHPRTSDRIQALENKVSYMQGQLDFLSRIILRGSLEDVTVRLDEIPELIRLAVDISNRDAGDSPDAVLEETED